MTTKELNRDIKRLYNKIESLRGRNDNNLFNYLDKEGRKEYNRLHDANKEADLLTLNSLKKMVDLNRRYRFVAFHNFYPSIKI